MNSGITTRWRKYQNGALVKIVSHGTEYFEDVSVLALANSAELSDAW